MFLVFYNLSLKMVLKNSSKLWLNVHFKVLNIIILVSSFSAYFQTSLMFLLMFSNGPITIWIEWTSFELSEKTKVTLILEECILKIRLNRGPVKNKETAFQPHNYQLKNINYNVQPSKEKYEQAYLIQQFKLSKCS